MWSLYRSADVSEGDSNHNMFTLRAEYFDTSVKESLKRRDLLNTFLVLSSSSFHFALQGESVLIASLAAIATEAPSQESTFSTIDNITTFYDN